MSSGVSQYLGGLVANIASVPQGVTEPARTLPIYTHLFFELAVTGVICTPIAFAVLPWMKRLGCIHAGET